MRPPLSLFIWPLFAYIGLCYGADSTPSPAMAKFRDCCEKYGYVENTTNYQLCVMKKEKTMEDECSKMAKDYNYGPFCFGELTSSFPKECVSQDYGKDAISQLQTQFLIMQLNYCSSTFRKGGDRLLKLQLQLQGY